MMQTVFGPDIAEGIEEVCFVDATCAWDNLTCISCKKISTNPYLCQKGHLNCLLCFAEVDAVTNTGHLYGVCCLCCSKSEIKPDCLAYNFVNSRTVECPSCNSWSGLVPSLQQHIEEECAMVQCPLFLLGVCEDYSCKEKKGVLSRGELNTHVRDNCASACHQRTCLKKVLKSAGCNLELIFGPPDVTVEAPQPTQDIDDDSTSFGKNFFDLPKDVNMFVHSVNQKYLCSRCNKVSVEPYRCNYGHMSCHCCFFGVNFEIEDYGFPYNGWEGFCPVCHRHGGMICDKNLKKDVIELLVRCPDCNIWVGSLSALREHIFHNNCCFMECPLFRWGLCSERCMGTILRRECDQHVRNNCEKALSRLANIHNVLDRFMLNK